MSSPRTPTPSGSGSSLDRACAVLGVVLLALAAALAGVIEAMLVPFRVGTVIVPIAIVAAVVSNVVLPWLAWLARDSAAVAAVPFGIWVIVVLVLSQGRPEGDVILPGGSSGLTYVSYGLLLGGFVAGAVTLALLAARGRRVR